MKRSNRLWIGIGLGCLALIVVPDWRGGEAPADRQDFPLSGDERSAEGSTARTRSRREGEPSASTPGLFSDLATLEAADERGELMGTERGPRTPEALMHDIKELRAEPFAPLVLDYIEKKLKENDFSSPRDQLQVAALLHRHGRESGTEFLRNFLQSNSGTVERAQAATALAMSKDEKSLPALVESMEDYFSHSYFGQAIGEWGDPALLAKAKSLLDGSSVPQGAIAMALVYAGDKTVVPYLRRYQENWLRDGGVDPLFVSQYEAALARLEAIPAGPIIERLRQAIQKRTPAVGAVPETLRLLGPDHAAPILEDIIRQYARLRAEFGEKYDAYADAVHAGTRSSSDMPEYPMAAEFLFQPALGLAKEWRTGYVASNLYEALAAAQTGRYTVLLNRNIMSVLTELDPDQSRLKLQGMGFSEKDIDAAFQLNQLRPIPYMLAPHQRTIAIGIPSRPEPP